MSIHLNFKEFVCETCGRAFKTKSMLKKHAHSHNVDRCHCLFFVVFFFETLFVYLQLKFSLRRRFKCCECGQVLKSTATLKNHMRQHTGIIEKSNSILVNFTQLSFNFSIEKGERPYSCHLCGKTFITCPSLSKHLRVHRNEKPVQCTVCSKRFATSYHLKVHSV